MRKPSRDLQRLAERLFGEPEDSDLGEDLERLTAALEALRAAFVPLPPHMRRFGRESFLESMERFAEAAGPLPPIAAPVVAGKARGDISEEAPSLLLNPCFWLVLDRLRADALAGDDESHRLLRSVLDRLKVAPHRFNRAKEAREARLARIAKTGIGGSGGPLYRLAVEITRKGRGPVPRRATELYMSAVQELHRVRRLDLERARTRDPVRRRELREESEALREELRKSAMTLEHRRDRAEKAARKRAETRGRK